NSSRPLVDTRVQPNESSPAHLALDLHIRQKAGIADTLVALALVALASVLAVSTLPLAGISLAPTGTEVAALLHPRSSRAVPRHDETIPSPYYAQLLVDAKDQNNGFSYPFFMLNVSRITIPERLARG